MLRQLMAYLTVTVMNIRDREEGQTLVEYGLIIALVSVMLIAALQALTGALDGVFDAISDALN